MIFVSLYPLPKGREAARILILILAKQAKWNFSII